LFSAIAHSEIACRHREIAVASPPVEGVRAIRTGEKAVRLSSATRGTSPALPVVIMRTNERPLRTSTALATSLTCCAAIVLLTGTTPAEGKLQGTKAKPAASTKPGAPKKGAVTDGRPPASEKGRADEPMRMDGTCTSGTDQGCGGDGEICRDNKCFCEKPMAARCWGFSAGSVPDCTDLGSDPRHCGACGHACANGQICFKGKCEGCDKGDTACRTTNDPHIRQASFCATLSNDDENCGKCHHSCEGGRTCRGGRCVF
jgi:hypothetical protein